MPPTPSSGSSSSSLLDPAVLSSLFAGATAGLVSDGVTHPISTVKSRIQTTNWGSARPPSTFSYFSTLFAREGFGGIYAGWGTLSIAAPARAFYFLGYEMAQRLSKLGMDTHVVQIAAGPIAQLSGSLLWVPMDVVKERMQVQSSRGGVQFANSMAAFRGIIAQEGIRGVYRGYWAHQFVWGPFNSVYFAVYNALKTEWSRRVHTSPHPSSISDATQMVPDGTPLLESTEQHMATLPNYAFPTMGAVAGCVAAAATAPIDLIKVRLQTQGLTRQYTGVLDCARKMIKSEGVASLFRGVGARCIWLSPNVALTMTVYEIIKEKMA